ncbi:hypothetical protein [Streptomyces sp. enrichment culture]|uniref:hypothetical protein n=1 Tax=Streptomyces sp. enrichment culture TaxID=1795815 RepID=UPI003F567B4E
MLAHLGDGQVLVVACAAPLARSAHRLQPGRRLRPVREPRRGETMAPHLVQRLFHGNAVPGYGSSGSRPAAHITPAAVSASWRIDSLALRRPQR